MDLFIYHLVNGKQFVTKLKRMGDHFSHLINFKPISKYICSLSHNDEKK